MAMVKERLKVDWTPVNRTAFIDAMIEVQESGIFTDSGFKTAQWTSIVKGFEIRTNLEYDKQQLQNQHAELKRKYGIFSALKNNSGFGWNSDLKLPTAPSEVWDDSEWNRVDEHAEVSGATCTAPSQPRFHPTPRFALRSLLRCSITVRRSFASNDNVAPMMMI